MNAKQQRALHRVNVAMAKAAQRHSYEYCPQRKALIVREPEIHDAGIVCTLAGDPAHPATNAQAHAICRALDALMKKEGWQ